ncbi:MAG: hypothetical protein U9Q06_01565 [Nanoarchaeota archaeon]|nr:hypothetical protein [Nanoarchaeota archaeon]
MEFNVLAYLNNDGSVKEIKDYNKYVSSGILLDEEMLYLLIVGEFVNKNKNKFSYLGMKKIKFSLDDFKYVTQFLNGFNTKVFFITPHIFTKFIHLLWENINDKSDYEKIIGIFNEWSEFIKEKNLDKEHFFKEENFKKMIWDLTNSSLILTSQNHKHNTILTCKWKTNNLCDKCGCLVIHYQNIKSAYLTKKYV